MPVDATAYNPRLAFMFRIYLDDFLAGTIEEVTHPTIEAQEILTSPGGVPFDRKTVGGATVGDMEIKRFKLADAADQSAIRWFRQGCDTQTRTVGYREAYKRFVRIEELGNNGQVVETFLYAGCHCKGISQDALNSLEKGAKVMQTITISVEERLYDT